MNKLTKNNRKKIILSAFSILVIFWPQEYSSSQPPASPTDTVKIVNLPDTVIINVLNKNNEKILKAMAPLKKSEKEVSASFKKLEKELSKKSSKIKFEVKTQPPVINTVIKKTFWQKFKSIFKTKKDGKNISK